MDHEESLAELRALLARLEQGPLSPHNTALATAARGELRYHLLAPDHLPSAHDVGLRLRHLTQQHREARLELLTIVSATGRIMCAGGAVAEARTILQAALSVCDA